MLFEATVVCKFSPPKSIGEVKTLVKKQSVLLESLLLVS